MSVRKNYCMLNKKDFLKYASKLAFPIMIQNLIGTLVNIADTVMLGYVSQTAMSASSLANQYTLFFSVYIMVWPREPPFYAPSTGEKVIKKTVEKILGLAERISLIVSFVFFVVSFSVPTTIMKIFTSSPDTIAAGSEYLRVISFSFMFMGFSQVFMSALRSIGKIMLPSVTYIVSLCVNVLCNATFIFGLFGLPNLALPVLPWYCYCQNHRSIDLPHLLIKKFRCEIQDKILLCEIWHFVPGFYENSYSCRNK